MNSIVKKFISIAVCLAMVMAFALPALAETENVPERDLTVEKLVAFLNQETNIPGVTNEMEMWAAGDRAIAEFQEEYQGLVFGLENEHYYIAPIFGTTCTPDGDEYISDVFFNYYYFCSCVDGNSTNIGLLEVSPDFYGPFDISGTKIKHVYGPLNSNTHITSVNADGCSSLASLSFENQQFCTELSALNCPSLYRISLRNGAYRDISVQLYDNDNPLKISTFGSGSIGMQYQHNVDPDNSTLYAYPTDELGFVGWFVDGERVSTEVEYVHQGGGRVYACFAGDVNGDGLINISDANLIMRGGLSLAPMENEAMFDLDSNGTVNTADALLAIRVGMGL